MKAHSAGDLVDSVVDSMVDLVVDPVVGFVGEMVVL